VSYLCTLPPRVSDSARSYAALVLQQFHQTIVRAPLRYDAPCASSTGLPLRYSALAGNSSFHGVHGVSIEQFMVDGVQAKSLHDLNTTVGPFVTGVTVE
jgi:hypothetical protein